MRMLPRLWADTDGQDLAEYTLLLAFVCTASAGILMSMPEGMAAIWSKVQSQIDTAAKTPGL